MRNRSDILCFQSLDIYFFDWNVDVVVYDLVIINKIINIGHERRGRSSSIR